MMKIGSEQFQDLIIAGGRAMGLPIGNKEVTLLVRHAQLLMEWNQRMNLTAITDPFEVAVKHYLDALAPLAYMPEHIPEGVSCLDIGTGGGFPGIPIKIMRPHQPMTLIDSIRKKITFIKQVIAALKLERIEALHIRAQELALDQTHQRKYDVVLCRALTDLQGITQLVEPLLAPLGRIIALKGPRENGTAPEGSAGDHRLGEISKIPQYFTVNTLEYRLPFLGDRRRLILMTLSPSSR